jgi:glycosyltransferase involved in cell wall biosynthesis
MRKMKVVFISNGRPDYASEELWSRSAAKLAEQGHFVSAYVFEWPTPHWRVQLLVKAGVHLQVHRAHYTLWNRAWHYIRYKGQAKAIVEIEKLLRSKSWNLVVFSDDFTYPQIELIELAVSRNLPFATISNANSEHKWPNDKQGSRYRKVFAAALRCYFVSKANLRLTEKQLGCDLPNAEVVWSQYNVDYNVSPVWPIANRQGQLRLACVARLNPPHKGQDILLEALASPVWASRSWHLTFYGNGSWRSSLETLSARLGLTSRVTFGGHVAVEEIWSANQVLVMPSRYEGMPLAVIEAMLCGRPVVATDVAGHSEIIVDGVTGFLADAATVPSMAACLERLWANQTKLEDMGRAGAREIRKLAPADPIRVFSDEIGDLINQSAQQRSGAR